ncbi:MAG: hypothetical protein AAF629_29230 [Chloroflexota bacterium]
MERQPHWASFGIAVFIISLAIRAAARERSQSIFDLERESATARLGKYLTYLFVTLSFVGGIFYVDTALINQIPLPEQTPTPTALVSLPDTPTAPALLPTPTPTLTPTPRTPIEETPEPLEEDILQAGSTPNCPIVGNSIVQPGNEATISGITPIIGSANSVNFSYYKLEFRVPGQSWNFIERYDTPVGEGQIATWNSATVPPGNYDLRLVVVDVTGNFLEPCQIRVTVVS